MVDFAMWRRLDTPGHDAAILTRNDGGWSLRGMAVFKHEAGPAFINYAVELDRSWGTISGDIRGFLAGRPIGHVIRRENDGWYLNGTMIAGLHHLVDLDYGFTPATNMQLLRRINLNAGQSMDVSVVWFDIDATTLTKLPQRYERRDETSYWYKSPTGAYEAMLQVSENGFARIYPDLWEMET
jgi:uncharacterized protein